MMSLWPQELCPTPLPRQPLGKYSLLRRQWPCCGAIGEVCSLVFVETPMLSTVGDCCGIQLCCIVHIVIAVRKMHLRVSFRLHHGPGSFLVTLDVHDPHTVDRPGR